MKNVTDFNMKIIGYLAVFGLVFVASSCFAADPLAASVRPQVAALFGTGSTISYCIYMAEIIIGCVSYVKTKNLMLLLGVPILMLFTSTMFTYVAG